MEKSKSKEERIIDLRREIERLKELIKMMEGDFSSGSYRQFGLPSTKGFLYINFDYRSDFSRILNLKFSEKLSAEIAIPIFTKKLEKKKKELFKLENPFWSLLLKKILRDRINI